MKLQKKNGANSFRSVFPTSRIVKPLPLAAGRFGNPYQSILGGGFILILSTVPGLPSLV